MNKEFSTSKEDLRKSSSKEGRKELISSKESDSKKSEEKKVRLWTNFRLWITLSDIFTECKHFFYFGADFIVLIEFLQFFISSFFSSKGKGQNIYKYLAKRRKETQKRRKEKSRRTTPYFRTS
jgi:hypothetical protein